jgi:hypothetical protein
VSFRHIGFQTDIGTVSGICLSYRSFEEAQSFFDYIHRYLSASGKVPRRLLTVKANKETDDHYEFSIEFGIGDVMRRIHIKDVEREYIDNIQLSLQVFKYFLIVASFDLPDGNISLLPLANNHIFLSRIKIDNQVYTGNSKCAIEWPTLIQAEHIILQPN